MTITRTAVLETTGSLDLVQFDNGVLSIAGWVTALDGTAIDELTILSGSVPLEQMHLELRLPSADVAAVYPAMPGSDRCRFQLRALAPGRQTDILLSVLPKAGNRPGRRLYHFIDPGLPQPPQEHVNAVGGGEFILVALEMLDYFIERAGLRPQDRVLDVGCGVGRIAYGLAYYLNENGGYDGFDVMPSLVAWANEHLASRLPRFHFQHVNVHNRLYNPAGTLRADRFSFPYPNATFDFVTVTSVFTHIPQREVRHYLNEIARVLAPGGRVAATAFLIDAEARDLIAQGRSTQPLVHAHKGGYVADRRHPEGAVGFVDADMARWIAESGLRLSGLYPGSWCGRSGGLSYQDLLVLEPAASSSDSTPRNSPGPGFSWLWRG